jgi:hypothetical protein
MWNARRFAARAVVILVVLSAAIQLIRPDRSNPPVDRANTISAHLPVPPDVQRILDHSCRDCHTNNTVWPWYSNVAPVSWFVAHDVHEGRDEMNFSEWGDYDRDTMEEQLEHICSEVRDGHMPIKGYTLAHPGTALTPPQVEAICRWTKEAAKHLPPE